MRLRQIQHELEAAGWKTLLVDNEDDAGIVAGAPRAGGNLFRGEAMRATPAPRSLLDLIGGDAQRARGCR